MPQGSGVCPNCGEVCAAGSDKMSIGKIVLLVALIVAAVGIVAALVLRGLEPGQNPPAEDPGTDTPTTAASAPTDPSVPATHPADGNPDDVTCKGTYTVTDEEVVALHETVVGTIGDASLTVGDLQVYYWLQVYDFLDAYGSYLAYMGLDYSQSLDVQLTSDGSCTWQQQFLDGALTVWHNYQSLYQQAKAEGFKLDNELAQRLAELPVDLEESAIAAGYEGALEMIQEDMGAGATVENYLNYLDVYYNGLSYYSGLMDAIELTDEEVEAYYDQRAEEYEEAGVPKDDAIAVDVRHILLQPQGGTTAEDGSVVYSEEEWEACRVEAQALLEQWLSGERTEDSFAQLAQEHSTDGGSASNGGLYTGVTLGQMVEPFEAWCFDETRAAGDSGLVKTTYGYHIMYFVNSQSVWFTAAEADLLASMGNDILAKAKETYPMKVDYSSIVLGNVELVAAS